MPKKEIEIKGENEKGFQYKLGLYGKKLNFVCYIQISIEPGNYYMASTCYGIFLNIFNFINFLKSCNLFINNKQTEGQPDINAYRVAW